MNWTGGKLQQHSRKNKSSVLQQQKQHFARARQQLQGPHRPPSAFKPAFLGSDDMSPQRQSRLHEFKSTAPLAKRLESLSARNERSSSRVSRPRGVPEDGDIARMLPPRHHVVRARKHGGANASAAAGAGCSGLKSSSADNDDLESARCRLLKDPDWLNLRVSWILLDTPAHASRLRSVFSDERKPSLTKFTQTHKPVSMKFVSTQDRDQFGRRHKVDRSAHHQQHESDGRRLRVPSIRNDLAFPIQRDDEVFDAGSLKIKIGDEALSSMWNTDINTYRANVGDEVEEDDFYGNVQVGTPHRNRHTSWESQDMLDTSSFHGFSDQSSHLRSRLRKLDSELSPFASPAAGVPFESEPVSPKRKSLVACSLYLCAPGSLFSLT
ncbi:MAG: hypothetical protein Q9162_002921 [Coniocarpon cinnabarinum]